MRLLAPVVPWSFVRTRLLESSAELLPDRRFSVHGDESTLVRHPQAQSEPQIRALACQPCLLATVKLSTHKEAPPNITKLIVVTVPRIGHDRTDCCI
jgi:hypothetical protein